VTPPALRASARFLCCCAVLLSLGAATRSEAGLDAGASTFESGERRYRARPLLDQDIVVPPVKVASEEEPSPEAEGPRFAIERFRVGGNTLLSTSQLEEALQGFVGPDRSLADVDKARQALQDRYARDGFLTVAVVIPQQTLEGGIVQLDVIEARVGEVEIQNDGIDWFGEAGIRRDLDALRPGAVLRQQDLQADMARANARRDLRVRPRLEAADEPGLVDVALVAEDRIPLHFDAELHNRHTPGSPRFRQNVALSYSNLWDLGHEASVRYEFVPNKDFSQVQIWAGTYRAPMPWNPEHSAFFYVAKSDTTNAAAGTAGISILGQGLNMGTRYRFPLPTGVLLAERGISHAVTAGLDRKDVENTLSASNANIVTPILYYPLSLAWDGTRIADHAFTNLRLSLNLNQTGFLKGDGVEQFQNNRGGPDPNDKIDGNFEIYGLALLHSARLPGILKTLGAGHFVALPAPDKSFADDWTLNLAFRGQVADQPLISTEQFPGGGVYSVRGYLEAEVFGDNAYNVQIEFRTPFFRDFFGGRLEERIQFLAFHDFGRFWTLNDPGVPDDSRVPPSELRGIGIGLRASLFESVRAELLFAQPLVDTAESDSLRTYFSLAVGF